MSTAPYQRFFRLYISFAKLFIVNHNRRATLPIYIVRRPEKNSAQCLVNDFRAFRATEGSTESVPLVFGVETVLWPTVAKKGGKWYRGVVEAVECLMTRWNLSLIHI